MRPRYRHGRKSWVENGSYAVLAKQTPVLLYAPNRTVEIIFRDHSANGAQTALRRLESRQLEQRIEHLLFLFQLQPGLEAGAQGSRERLAP